MVIFPISLFPANIKRPQKDEEDETAKLKKEEELRDKEAQLDALNSMRGMGASRESGPIEYANFI